MEGDIYKDTVDIIPELEKLEKDNCHLRQIFAEVLKDEINAIPEDDLYNNVKSFINTYSGDAKAINIINEFTEIISGGASLNEILQITRDEVVNPTIVTEITTDKNCN